MDTYKSDKQTIACNAGTIFSKLTNPSLFKAQIEAHAHELPAEARENLGMVSFGDDSIAINSPLGEITMAVDHEHSVEGRKVVYSALQSPVKFNFVVNLEPRDEQLTDSVAEINLDLPFFMRAMVGSKLADGAKKFGEVLARLPFERL